MEPQANEKREYIQLDAHYERASGPIPPPKMMREYEDVLPGSADRIWSMAEREQERQIDYDNRGLLFGFIVALILIALNAYVVSLGFAWQSVGVVIGSIASTAGTFIYSNHNRARRLELRERRAALQQPAAPPELPDSTSQSPD